MHDTSMPTRRCFGGGVHALRCGLDFFGPDRWSSHRHAARPIKPAIDALKALDLSAADRRKLFAGKPRKTFAQDIQLICFAKREPR